MFVRVVVRNDVVSARRGSHGPRVHQNPRLVVVEAVPVGCAESRYYKEEYMHTNIVMVVCPFIIQCFAKLQYLNGLAAIMITS